MIEFRADLHCHTTCSDGTFSPREILQHAKKMNLQGLSITDHDSVDAYAHAIPAAKEMGIQLISGIECSAAYKGVSIHILGYSFSLNHPSLHSFCDKHKQRRRERNQQIMELLAKQNMPLHDEEIFSYAKTDFPESDRTIGRPHIAWAMLKKGYVQTTQEAFKYYIGEGKSCYVPGSSISVEETIDLIHQAKGFAIIAHPHLIKENQIIPDLLKMGFDGLEGYYACLTPSQNARWLKIAQKKNWIITGGSDFHGEIKPIIELGSSWVGQETFDILQKRYEQNNNTTEPQT